jgi:DNA-binding NarL/FixJ family response regulator
VVATLHTDMFFRGRNVDSVDRDVVCAFANSLSHALERAVLIERLHAQGAAVRRLVAQTAETVATFQSEELHLGPLATPISRPDPAASAPLTSPTPRAVGPASPDHYPRWYQSLTPRELEVLELIATGASNTAIAAKLVVTEGTVKSHVKKILRKLGATNRSHAVVMFLRARDRTPH